MVDIILHVLHDRAKCCMAVTFMGGRHPEPIGFACVNVPLQTSGEPLGWSG